jgi:cell division protein FtsW
VNLRRLTPHLRLLVPFVDPTVREWTLPARMLRWLTFLWLAIGLVVMFSASYYHGQVEKGDGLYYFIRQTIAILIAAVIFNAIVHTPLKRLLNIAHWGLLITLGLIFATLLPGLGKNVLGATRWIAVGPLQLQPSELIKPFIVLQGAKILGQWNRYPLKVKLTWGTVFLLILLAILKQPNLSTTALCGMSLWLMAVAGGLPFKHLGITAIGGVILASLSMIINPYQLVRMMSFIDPWAQERKEGFQLVQSLISIGSGGFWGNGFGLSNQKLGYLPIQDTDFIFSVFAEEFGFVGSILLLTIILTYATLGIAIAQRCSHPVHRLIAIGSTVFIVLQSLLNIGVASGVLPTTGLPLPLFSYGGNSAISSLFQTALLIRVARESSSAKIITIETNDRDRVIDRSHYVERS